MNKFPLSLLLATALLIAAAPLTAQASSLVYGGVLEYDPGAAPYSIFGMGGSLSYTLTFNFDAPLSPTGYVAMGDFTGDAGIDMLSHSAQNMYGYSSSDFTNVTITTAFGSMTFDPTDPFNPADPLDPYSFFSSQSVGLQTSDFWFDTDINVSEPTKAIFDMGYNDPVSLSNPVWGHYHRLGMTGNLQYVLIGEDFPPADPDNAFLLVWNEVPLSFVGYEDKSDIVQVGYYSMAGTFAAVPEPGGAMLLGLTGAASGLIRRRRRKSA